MGSPPGLQGLRARIRRRYAALPPQEQRAADVVLARLDDLPALSGAEIAQAAGVSRATVSRLFRSLGFASFVEVKEEARSLRARGVPVLVTSDGQVPDVLAQEVQNLTTALADAEGLQRAAALVAGARRVVVLGLRSAYPVALHCRQQLTQVRDEVRLLPLPGQSLGEDLHDLRPDDAAVLFGFRRRPRGITELVDLLTTSGASLVLVADESARQLGAQIAAPHAAPGAGGVWLECSTHSSGPLDSYAAPMALVSALANQVALLLGEPSAGRARAIADAYEVLGELDE